MHKILVPAILVLILGIPAAHAIGVDAEGGKPPIVDGGGTTTPINPGGSGGGNNGGSTPGEGSGDTPPSTGGPGCTISSFAVNGDGKEITDTLPETACERKGYTDCFGATNDAGIPDKENTQIETRACQYMRILNLCVKPCHKRTQTECEQKYKYITNKGYDTEASSNPFPLCAWVEGNNGYKCAPLCNNTSNILYNLQSCDSNWVAAEQDMLDTVGCIKTTNSWDGYGVYYKYTRCDPGWYYSYKLDDIDNEQCSCGYGKKNCVYSSSCGECTKPEDKHGDYDPLRGFYVGEGGCAWEARCYAGYGRITSSGCAPCSAGNYSDAPISNQVFDPSNGFGERDTSACKLCTADHYCDGTKTTPQQCPVARQDVTGMKSKPGAKSRDECYIDKDTVFCDSKGCFTLPIGDKEILHSK